MRTFKARDYGAVPDGVSDAGPGIRAAISAAASSGQYAEVLLESGQYRIKTLQDGRFHITLNGARHFTLRCVPAGTQLIFTNPGNPAFGIFGCTDTFLKDFIIDYDPVPFTQGTVVAIDKADGTFDMDVDTGYPVLSNPWFTAGGMGEIIDRSKRRLKSAVPDYAFVDSWVLQHDRVWRMKFNSSTADRLNYMAVGDAYVHLARLPGGTIEMNSCTDGGVDNVTMYASPGLSLLLAGSETATTLDRFQIRFKPGSTRLIASNGDGAHCQQNRQGPKMDSCYFEGLCDDGVNIYCRPNIVQEVRSTTQIVVNQYTNMRAGDLIQICDLVNGAVRAEVNVTSVQMEGSNYVITLSAPVSGVQTMSPADHVYNLSACGAGFIVKNSTFSNHRRHGLNIRGINGLVEGNTFDHTGGFGVCASNEPGWPEGPIPRELTFRGNTFLGGADSLGYSTDGLSAALRVFALKNSGLTNDRVSQRITIENNKFTDPPKACVFLGSVQDAWVRNNTANSANPFVLKSNCAGVVEENNTLVP
ncbi:MAG: right-handed parallel beta-helix repeat-containing protein [Armatimonadota bacterium]